MRTAIEAQLLGAKVVSSNFNDTFYELVKFIYFCARDI